MITLGILLMVIGPFIGAGIAAIGGILNAKDQQKQQKEWQQKQEFFMRDEINNSMYRIYDEHKNDYRNSRR